MSTLTVELNGDGVHSIEAPARFVTDESFSVELVNRGQATHAHLNLDDALSQVATLAESNHYVDGDRTEQVRVRITNPETSVRGKLKVVTGHGSGVELITVVVEPPSEEDQPVIVDESLAHPPKRDPDPTMADRMVATLEGQLERGTLPAVLLLVAATLLAIGVTLSVNSPVVFVGAAIVIGASIAAAFLVLQ